MGTYPTRDASSLGPANLDRLSSEVVHHNRDIRGRLSDKEICMVYSAPIKRTWREDEMLNWRSALVIAFAFSTSLVGVDESRADPKNYGPGVSDAEIKIGNTAPYS